MIAKEVFFVLVLVHFTAQVSAHKNDSKPKKCMTSAECNDGNSCTLNFCDKISSSCLALPKQDFIGDPSCNATHTRMTLEEVLRKASKSRLSLNQKLDAIDIAITLLEGIHPHRQLHLSFLGADPVPHLERLRRKVQEDEKIGKPMLDMEFHNRLRSIFYLLQDLHTEYRGAPQALDELRVLLPITIADYYEKSDSGSTKFVLTDVADGLVSYNSTFERGVRIVSWNSVQIELVIKEIGVQMGAANMGAVRRFGLQQLTTRDGSGLPEASSVRIGYIDAIGAQREIDLEWVYFARRTDQEAGRTKKNHRTESPLCRNYDEFVRSNSHKFFFAEQDSLDQVIVRERTRMMKLGERMEIAVDPRFEEKFAAEVISTTSGNIGRIQIVDFEVPNPAAYSKEFSRLTAMLPPDGIVIDIRGNTGGDALASYGTLFPFTDKPISAFSTAIRITPTTLNMTLTKSTKVQFDNFLRVYGRSMVRAAMVGDSFSAPIDDISPDMLSFLQQKASGNRYRGPVVVLMDGISYSAAEVMVGAAQDNGIAWVVGIDEATGGGGSDTMSYSAFKKHYPDIFSKALPPDISMSVSFRRVYRGGASRGDITEYFGIEADERYFPTLQDRLGNDVDLFEYLGITLSRLGEQVVQSPEGEFEHPERFTKISEFRYE